MKRTLLIALVALFSQPVHAAELIQVDVPEPSGIDHDRDGERFFVVDDGGELWVFDEDYNEIDVFDLGGDLEGVDYLPVTDQLLIAVEGDEQLLLVDPDSGDVESVFDIPRTFQGRTILEEGGNGIETLTVVGRRIFVVNQSFDYQDQADGSVLVELVILPDETLEIVDAHRLPILDVAGSFYFAPTREFFLLSDYGNRIHRLNLKALDSMPAGANVPPAFLHSFLVPGDNQEGICLVRGELIIAQDSGDLYNAGSLQWLMSDAGQLGLSLQWAD